MPSYTNYLILHTSFTYPTPLGNTFKALLKTRNEEWLRIEASNTVPYGWTLVFFIENCARFTLWKF